MVGFFELRLDFLYFLHGLALALLAGAAWGLSHLENRRTWSWLALFAASQAGSMWLRAVTSDLGGSEVLSATRAILLGGSFFCLVQFARRKLYGMGILRLNNWIHAVPASLLLAGIFWFGEGFLKWYMPVLGLLSGSLASLSFLARSRSTRRRDLASRLRNCCYAIGSYTIVMGFLALLDFAAGQDPGEHRWLPLLVASTCTLLAAFACWTVGYHYSLQHHARLASQDVHWTRKRAIQLGVMLLILASGTFYADRAMHQKDQTMRNDILLRTRLLAASIPPEHIATFKWDHTDLENPSYLEVKKRMMSLVKANPDIRFLMLTGLRDGHAYFLVDSEPADSPDYSPPGQHYDDADEEYLTEAHKRHDFVLGPIADHWGVWISSSVPLGEIGEARNWVMAEADISASNWSATLRAARLPALLSTLLISLLFLTYFYAQDRIHESLARLTVSEQRTSTLVEGSPNCVQMFDPSGICTMINQNGLNAFDRRRDEIIGKHILSIWPPHMQKPIKEAFDFTLTGHSTVFESEYYRPDGVIIIWRVALTAVLDEQRNIGSLVAIGVDISDLKQTEKDLLFAKETAEAATRAKSEFLAVMSHEIRTPLGGVIGMLNVLRKHPMEPEQQLYTELAHENAENLLSMLDDILDAAKVEAGKLTLENIPFDPALEFGRVFEPMRVRAEAKGLDFKWTLAPDLPPVLDGDPTRLRQILANLLSNAHKFTEHGSIRTVVSCKAAAPGCVNLRIDVTDTGIGIEPEKIAQLFSKFEQADVSTTRRFGGTGLGLSIVKHIAELMAGSVQVRSTPGHGTTFSFTARVGVGSVSALTATQDATATQSPLPRHHARLHILCAEDDLTNQVAAEFLVKQMGHSIEFVDDGRKAVEWLSRQRANVVLMDNRMPVMDGFQATKQIRDPASAVIDHDVYIIANTANATSGYRERCLAAGMNDYLTKPLREEELHAALDKALYHLEQKGTSLAIHEGASRPSFVHAAPPASPPSSNHGGHTGLSEEQLLAIINEAETKPATPPQLPVEALCRITELYFLETPLRLLEMRDALAKPDHVSLGRAAHSLKGNSRYIQAETLASVCAEIEKLADDGQLDHVSNLIARAETEYATLCSQRKLSRTSVTT